MFGFLKNILRRPADAPAQNEEPPAEMEYPPAAMPAPVATPGPRPMVPRQNGGRPAAGYQAPPGGFHNAPAQRPHHQNHQNGGGKGIEVPLQKILEGLPLELQPRVRHPEVGNATISIPLEKVLSQLSRGSVRISFGELRQAAPGVFSSETDRDRVLVQLPLNEILAQLNPALIARRRVQKQVEVPDDISSPFDSQNQSGFNFSIGSQPSKAPQPKLPQPKAPPLPPAANPFQANPFQQGQHPFQQGQHPFQQGQHPFQQGQNPFQPAQNPFQPAHNQFQPPPAPPQNPFQQTPIPFQDIPNPFQQPPKPPAPPTPPLGIPAGRNTITSAPTPQPPASEPLISPVIAAASRALRDFENKGPNSIASTPFAPESGNSQDTLAVALMAVAESWPDGIRKEIVQLNLMEAKVHLPVDAIGQGLKQGRIAFSWKTVRSWIKAPGLAFTSPQDATMLELPLKVIAPLFMTRQRETCKEQQKVKIDGDIPNLFFGFPQADSPPAAVAKPKDTNYYVWDDPAESVQAQPEQIRRSSPGTKFITRYATPNEVVSRAAALEGVSGALIALPDGLMVASQLSPDVNGDTLAAFLPQIFAKVSQCTKELRMGELNNLNFTVGNVPWKIFRVNAIFFAAFGRAGEPLPTGQLAALASELDHKG